MFNVNQIENIIILNRFMPPVTPSTWRNTRLADRFSPVCPQVPPVSGDDALFDIPRGRLAQLRRILPLLANQSEDCLYLNLYVPRSGNLSLWFFFFSLAKEQKIVLQNIYH